MKNNLMDSIKKHEEVKNDLKTNNEKNFERALINKANNQKQLDTILVSINTGTLALSMNFFFKFASEHSVKFIKIMFISWGCFVLGMICSLIGFSYAVKQSKNVIDQINDNNYIVRITPKFNNTIKSLNFSSLTLTIVGFILITFFAILNLSRF